MSSRKEIKLTKELAKRLQSKFPDSRIYANKCPSRAKRIKEAWNDNFNEVCPPLQPEIDLIFLDTLSENNPTLRAVEIKYFERKRERVSQSFYKGIEQSLALLQWGFDSVALWQLFDESISVSEIKNYGCRTWFYVQGVLGLPLDFTPIRLVPRENGLGFQVVQSDWRNYFSPIWLNDIDSPGFNIRWRNDNPLAHEQLRRERFRDMLANPDTRPLFERMFSEVDMKRNFLLSWLPEQERNLGI